MSNLAFAKTGSIDHFGRLLPPGVINEFFGGGKTATTTQSVQIPPEVLARYNSVNSTAQQVAQTPFQQYSTDPNAFVAPLNQQQQAGIAGTNAYANAALPGYEAGMAATGMAGPTNVGQLSGQQIGQYMNPFVQSVVNPTAQLLNQQQQTQMSGQTGNAIQQGAFGGDRTGIAAANLAGQQNLAFANAINPLYSQAYNTALSTAQGQQAFNLQQQQANNQLLLQQGAQFGNLGAGMQTAGLQGAQAQLSAGTLGQQTTQAGLSALYNQFLQQQAYPFQTTQFLANIAEGTGALSGSNTTTTQPSSFFSDERLKDDVEDIGRTHDGQKIVKFRYKGEKGPKQIGLIAQDVEKHHPEAVGLAGGYKTVDYDKATEDAASMGGSVIPERAGLGFAAGGYADGGMPPYLNMYGTPGGQSRLPPDVLAAIQNAGQRKLMLANPSLAQPQKSELQQGLGAVEQAKTAYNDLSGAKGALFGSPANGNQAAKPGLVADVGNWLNKPGPAQQLPSASATQSGLVAPPVAASDPAQIADAGSWANQGFDIPTSVYRGGLVRHHYDAGGSTNDDPETNEGLYKTPGPGLDIPEVNPNAKLATPGAPGSSSGGGNPLSAVTGLASAAGTIGNGIGDILGFLALKNGGLVHREHHADGDSVGDMDTAAGLIPDNYSGLGAADVPAAGAQEAAAQGPTISDKDRDMAIRTIVREAGGEPELGQAAVAHVINNRLNSGSFGKNISDIVTAPNQFTPWNKNNAGTSADPRTVDPDSPVYKKIGNIFDAVRSGAIPDPTKGALNFANPRDATAPWVQKMVDSGNYVPIGNHIFGTSGEAPTGLAGAAPTRTAQTDTSPPDGGLGGGRTQYAQAAPTTMTDAGPQGGGLAPAGGFLDQAGDFFTKHQNAIVPILTGLATMASSPSRYLGAAILQGLGGGAQAYENLQKQQAEYGQPGQVSIPQQRVNIEAMKAGMSMIEPLYNLKGQIVGYRNKFTGQPMSPSDISKYVGATGIPSSTPTSTTPPVAPASIAKEQPSATPAAQPAAQPPVAAKTASTEGTTQANEAAPAVPSPSQVSTPSSYLIPSAPYRTPEEARMATLSNPQVAEYHAEAKKWQNELNNAQDALLHLDQSTASATQVNNRIANATKNLAFYRNAELELQNQYAAPTIKALQDNNEANQKYFDEQAVMSQGRQQSAAQLTAIQNVLEHFEPGTFAREKQNLAGALRSAGIDVPDSATANPAAFQEFTKNMMLNVFSQVKQLAGPVKVAELSGFEKASPNPELQPEANRKILAQNIGILNMAEKHYQDELKARDAAGWGYNRSAFQADWSQQNDPNKFISEAEKGLAVRGATPKSLRDLVPDQAYIIEPSPKNGLKAPTKVIFKGINPDTNQPRYNLVK